MYEKSESDFLAFRNSLGRATRDICSNDNITHIPFGIRNIVVL